MPEETKYLKISQTAHRAYISEKKIIELVEDVSITFLTPERRRISLESALAFTVLKREDIQNAEDDIRNLKDSLRHTANENDGLAELLRGKADIESQPATVEAYGMVILPKINVQGIGDVPIYGCMAYTQGGSEIKSDRLVVATDHGMGYVEIYHTNRNKRS